MRFVFSTPARRMRAVASACAFAHAAACGTAIAASYDVLDTAQQGVEGVDGLEGARALAVSPNGANVYVVAATESAISAFAVGGDGSLTFVDVEKSGVASVTGMFGPVDVAVSPDGAHVYVASFAEGAIAIFARDPGDGSLTFVDAVFEADLPSGGLLGASGVAVSPDGKHVYATAGLGDAVAAFERDAATGALTWVETESGDTLLDGAVDLAVSSDGAFVYVLAQGVAADSLVTYARDPMTGALTKFDFEKDGVDGVQGLTFPNAMAIAPGDRDLYTVAGYQGSQGSIAGKLSLFARSPVDDTTQYFTLWGDGVNGVDGLDYAIGVALTKDGRTLLATGASDGALAVFTRDPATGLLSFDRAIRDDSDAALLLSGAIDVATDPLGRFVYVVSINEGALTVFAPEPGAAALGAAACAALALRRRRARAAKR